MSGPRHFRRPLFNLGRKRETAEWLTRFAGFASRIGGKRQRPSKRGDGKDTPPPGSGMPADPPKPPAPHLSGGAAAPLDFRD
ncbi:hypothetical protein A6F65_01005 [Paraurantiacibacter namhicola]|uniref:Uncharacterized protein n=1 Tax=Paraurantiacibacter namhicola TaxID=645517 RepID=A0A1C7D786_9SPHN|nr:hypothetical protein A6F65_01005 [Paraurantiacibacter namhicola]